MHMLHARVVCSCGFSTNPRLACNVAGYITLEASRALRRGWLDRRAIRIAYERKSGRHRFVTNVGWTSCRARVDTPPAAHEERELLTQLWAILKTQLFTTLMLSQTILSTVVFTAPPHDATSSTSYSPYLLTKGVLCTLSHLAFVIQQFGGVTTTTQNGFPELKRVFYMALDVLSASTVESARFVSELCQEINKHGKSSLRPTIFYVSI